MRQEQRQTGAGGLAKRLLLRCTSFGVLEACLLRQANERWLSKLDSCAIPKVHAVLESSSVIVVEVKVIFFGACSLSRSN